MHRTGLQVDILRNHLPRINYEVNKILSDVVNFQVFLRIEEGETDIDIVMQYGEMDTRPAQMASGMEKLLINMAIRYALLTVSNLNTSSSWFIDEGFGVLDAENMSAMSQFFDNVRSVFRNIIIITHIDTLKDVSDWTIGIERRDEISVANSPVKNI
jgi:DNA repair exonuclease SbcCD ATPase subunit